MSFPEGHVTRVPAAEAKKADGASDDTRLSLRSPFRTACNHGIYVKYNNIIIVIVKILSAGHPLLQSTVC